MKNLSMKNQQKNQHYEEEMLALSIRQSKKYWDKQKEEKEIMTADQAKEAAKAALTEGERFIKEYILSAIKASAEAGWMECSVRSEHPYLDVKENRDNILLWLKNFGYTGGMQFGEKDVTIIIRWRD